MGTAELLSLLLGGGLVATITAFFTGVKSLQSGARAREKETVTDLVRQRKDAWKDRDYSNDVADYWRNWAGTVEFEAKRNGVELPPRPPEPKRPVEEEEEE